MTLEKIGLEFQCLSSPLMRQGLHLLPVGFETLDEGHKNLDSLMRSLARNPSLEDFCERAVQQENGSSKFAAVLMGASPDELIEEARRALEGIGAAMENGKNWQTPNGSYFSPDPLGPKEKIAFVYPGAFGTYVGMGQDIFNLFPGLDQAMELLTDDTKRAINAEIIFPKTDDESEIQALQAKLDRSPTMMISSGICFSYLYTVILEEYFGMRPDAVFGYSLGENSMMFAVGIWSQADAMRTSLETSPIFHERVSGRQTAIREYWGLGAGNEEESIWSNYVLMAPYEKVIETIWPDERVYVTHINTPRQVVIGGDDAACRRVADALKCMHLKAPYNHAIHCPPVASEFEHFVHLHHWPVECEPGIPVYSAADYQPLEMESRAIAEGFARMLTQPIDFPRLVNRAYEDGARVFIELGAGSNCSKWVDAVLKDKRHVSASINHVNVEDHVSIMKLLAKLISHRVSLDLSSLVAA